MSAGSPVLGGIVADGRVDGVSICRVATRFGIKGPGAPQWLASHGVPMPPSPNHIVRWTERGGGRCLRLGSGEFLVEHDLSSPMNPLASPAGAGDANVPDAFVLLRADASFLLHPPHWPRELAQVCSYDFARFAADPDLVVMTLLAGIGVTLAHEPAAAGAGPALRLWCDASHSDYLQDCLRQLAVPLRGEHR